MKHLFENFYIDLCLIKTRLYIKDYRHIKWRSTFLPYLVEMRLNADSCSNILDVSWPCRFWKSILRCFVMPSSSTNWLCFTVKCCVKPLSSRTNLISFVSSKHAEHTYCLAVYFRLLKWSICQWQNNRICIHGHLVQYVNVFQDESDITNVFQAESEDSVSNILLNISVLWNCPSWKCRPCLKHFTKDLQRRLVPKLKVETLS
jgi:hypothetical protein